MAVENINRSKEIIEKINSDRITLEKLVHKKRLQSLQDSYSMLVRMSGLICDEYGVPITELSKYSPFCSDYCYSSTLGKKRCSQCGLQAAREAMEKKESVIYTCPVGLLNYVAPIVLDDELIGFIGGGQVLAYKVDEELVKKNALELGLDENEFLEARNLVQIIPMAAIERGAAFIYKLAGFISDLAADSFNSMELNRQAMEAAKAKADFLANMSHEIRTPMNAVLGMAQLAQRKDMSPEVKGYINQIVNAGKLLVAIVNDILDYSKIEAGKMEIIPDTYNPMIMLDEIYTMVSTRIGDKNLELIMDMDDYMPSGLYGDIVRIKQIIINLANNAVKFTEKGSVLVKAEFENIAPDLSTGQPQINLKISVQDTGIGIKDEDISKLFEAFQQVDSKRNRNVEGTGLGLAIVRKLLEAMNGHMTIKSEYGKGSTFAFVVPQKVTNSTPVGSATRESAESINADKDYIAPKARILVVDDNQINLDIVTGILEPIEMHIDTALSGKKAIEMLENTSYDLVFMDHMMPEMDGVETTRIIRRLMPQCNRMPILALTANVVSEAKQSFIDAGMNDFLPKPVEYALIKKKLKEWLPVEKIEYTDVTLLPEQKELVDIPGLDTAYAINLLGSKKIYLKVIEEYYKTLPKKVEKLKESLEKNDCRQFTIDVHALKSSSKQIGAIELSEAAAYMENLGNDEEWDTILSFAPGLFELTDKCFSILEDAITADREKNQRDAWNEENDREHSDEKGSGSDSGEQYFENRQEFFAILSDAFEGLDMDRCEELILQAKKQYKGSNPKKLEWLNAMQESIEAWDYDTCAHLMAIGQE